MHVCEFCHTDYFCRPQVKTPRACQNCQVARQRANEREWRKLHTHFDDRYHSIRREQRLRKIRALLAVLLECLRLGQRLLGMTLKVDTFSEILEETLVDLGVRRINKFCDFKSVIDFKFLSGGP